MAALLGDGAVERALASLAEMISAPLLRLALRGDLPTLVDRLRPLVESLLKLAANRELPEAQRVAAYRQATRDAVDSSSPWQVSREAGRAGVGLGRRAVLHPRLGR